MIKSIKGQLYKNLWQNAAYELENAEKVVFCGYSLPVADFEFRHLLKQSINQNAQIDVVLYKNDNPKEYSDDRLKKLLPEKRYLDLFACNRCTFFYDGFGEYFRDMCSAK